MHVQSPVWVWREHAQHVQDVARSCCFLTLYTITALGRCQNKLCGVCLCVCVCVCVCVCLCMCDCIWPGVQVCIFGSASCLCVFVHILNPYKSRHVGWKYPCLVTSWQKFYTHDHTDLWSKSMDATQAFPLEKIFTHTQTHTNKHSGRCHK